MKKKLSIRFVLSMLLAAMMFCMPAGAFMMNAGNTVTAFAQDTEEPGSVAESTEATEPESETSGGENGSIEESSGIQESESAGETEGTGELESGEGTGETEGTVSGNEVKPVCICTEKCSIYKKNAECEVCGADYLLCVYTEPNVKITIKKPSGWYRNNAKVSVSVEDTLHTGNFAIQTVEAKISQNGSWTDITEDMYLEISENCSVYVRVTDQRGKTYEKNRSISCFDTTKPTLNAAVSDGLLSIQAQDGDSGIASIYVNGHEFTDISNGTLNVRLQQFDAGYQNFTIQAVDEAGNMSDVYKTANPYYTDPEKESDSTQENPAGQLPVNAEATPPGKATANVTEHVKTDGDGNKVVAEKTEDTEGEVDREQGKEFYTIQTATEKVFYLVIDRNGEEEVVYFLTGISENDLLNVTSDNSGTLPKNSAALESAIPTEDTALPNNNETEAAETTEEDTQEPESTEDAEPEVTEREETAENPVASYIFFGIVAVIAVAALYFFKVYRRKGEDFEDDDEDEEDAEEIYENEDEESEDDFFEQKEGEEE